MGKPNLSDIGAYLLTRTYLSLNYIQAASFFARRAYESEVKGIAAHDDELIAVNRSFVLGSIMSAVAFLESTVNELFADAAEDHDENLEGLDSVQIARLKETWSIGVPRTAAYSVLQKYDIALVICGQPPFNRGAKERQDANDLIRLRNALIHYEPEWIPAGSRSGPDALHKLARILKLRFPLNPLYSPNNPLYPDRCLSSGCTRWAVASCLNFTDKFFRTLGVKVPPYEHIRSRVNANLKT